MPRTHIVDPTVCGSSTKPVTDPSLHQYPNRVPASNGKTQNLHRSPMDNNRFQFRNTAFRSDGRSNYDPSTLTDTALFGSRATTDDCQSYNSQKWGFDNWRQERDIYNGPGGGPEAMIQAHNHHYLSMPPLTTLPGDASPWHYCTTPNSDQGQKRSLYLETTRTDNEMEKNMNAEAATSMSLNSPFHNVAWMGSNLPRRNRRRYQLWRESRQFLDTCYYYGNRGMGAKQPYCFQGPRPQVTSQPPPLLPLVDMSNSSSGGPNKPAHGFIPVNDTATTSQLPPHPLYPPGVNNEPSTLQLAATTANGQHSSGGNTHKFSRFLYPLTEIGPPGLPRNQQLYHNHQLQRFPQHSLPDYASYLYNQLHLPTHNNMGDTRYPSHFCSRQEVAGMNQAPVQLPPVTAAEEALRSQHGSASYLRNMRTLLSDSLV